MSVLPWASDRPLADATARQLIAGQFPQLEPVRITARAEGWDNQVVEIGGEWMFRFPKRADYVPHFERELKLLPRLAPRLPLPIPHYEFLGRPAPAFPYPFAGYRKLAGVPATQVSAAGTEAVAAQLGAALSALHATPLANVADLEMPHAHDDPLHRLRVAREELDAVAHALTPGTHADCRAFLKCEPTGFEQGTPLCVLHNDLGDEHLLLSLDGRRVEGIIDWTDAALGDPARDFAGLWAWQGEEFTALVLAAYSPHIGTDFLVRIRFYGLCGTISNLDYALKVNDEPRVESALHALRRLRS